MKIYMRFKKSQIFMLDLILSSVIFLLVIIYIYSYEEINIDESKFLYVENQKFLDSITKKNFFNINDKTNFITLIEQNNSIENFQNSIIRQSIKFYDDGNKIQTNNTIKSALNNYEFKNFNYEIYINESLVFQKINLPNLNKKDLNNVNVLKREISIFNYTDLSILGKKIYIVKSKIWN